MFLMIRKNKCKSQNVTSSLWGSLFSHTIDLQKQTDISAPYIKKGSNTSFFLLHNNGGQVSYLFSY